MNQAADIIDLLTKIQEKANLLRHGEDVTFDGVNLAEVHCIDQIGMIDYANVTKVASAMGMIRGTISKINKRLLNKGLIESYQVSENNKEIYYRLTKSGEQVYLQHRRCHETALKEKFSILNSYSEYEQAIILRFLSDINRFYDRKLMD